MEGSIGELTSIKTGKLDANASVANGRYPFFTCSKETLTIDSYSYDCECVLVAGNGDLNVKYYNGKFDAYQRTYIIEDASDGKIYMKYLYWFMSSYIDELRKQAIGGVIKYIKLGNLTGAKIQLPSIKKQMEIVNIITKVNNVLCYRESQLQKLDELIQARFVEMFGGLHNSKLYPYVSIETFTDVTSGGTPNRNTKEYWENGNIRWVKTTELHNNFITDTEEYITRKGIDNSSAKVIPAHSILVAMYGQGKTRGMTGYLLKECTTNQACACILPCKRVDQKYLWYYMILSYDKLRGMAKGGNQPNLNIGIIKRFQVLVPPIELQNQFADFVNQVNKSKLVIKNLLQIYKHQIQM